jgi:hypothetical protein
LSVGQSPFELLRSVVAPERSLNSPLVHLMNQHDKVVAKNLAQNLVPHGGFRLTAAQRVGKLSLHGAEGRFDIRAFAAAVIILFGVLLRPAETLFPVFIAGCPMSRAFCETWESLPCNSGEVHPV